MLYLNKAIIPDPDNPVAFDAYGGERGPELVVVAIGAYGTTTCAFRGALVDAPGPRFEAVIVSAGLRPLGRLERRERGVKPRPEDFDLAAAVNDLGPRLRALREQTGLRIGEFARAVGCPMPELSRVELGEWVPGPQALGRGAFAVDPARDELDLMQRVLRLARVVERGLRAADHPVWPNQGTMHIIKNALMQEMRVEGDTTARAAILAASLVDALLKAGGIIQPGNGAAAEMALFAALNPEPAPASE